MTEKEIGKLIANARKQKSITLLEIKNETKVQPFQVMSMEKATANYTIKSLMSVCRYLNIEIIASLKN